MAKFMTYGNNGGIESIINRENKSIRYFDSYNELLTCYKEEFWYCNNFNLMPYGYDSRLNTWVMMLVADYTCMNEEYKKQFMVFAIIVEDE